MPNSSQPNYVLNCDWDCTAKVQSRIITIIHLYRDIFGVVSIPKGKQYWTMCGAHFNAHGDLDGELGHLLKSGLIRPHQFHGVDREAIIIQRNSDMFPRVKWYHGDFLEVMESRTNFNPAIINYDGVMQPRFGVRYLKSILKFIDHNIEDELLMIANFLLTNPYTYNEKLTFSIEDTIKELSSIYWIPDHWEIIPQAYTYKRGRGSNSLMGIVMFIKNKHDMNNISITKNRRIFIPPERRSL